MEVNQLRYFWELSRGLNFSHSAEQLGISQSALSRSIAKLEQEVGVTLFERTSQGLLLTDAGTLLVKRTQQILGLIDDTLRELQDDGVSGKLRVGAIPTIAPYLLPSALKSFGQRYPRAAVVVQEDVTEQLVQRCRAGTLDVAVVSLPISAQYLEQMELFIEPLWMVLPDKHPLARRKHIPLTVVAEHPLILLGENHCLSEQIANFCQERSIHPVAVETTSQLTTIQELVALGHGLSLIPDMARKVDQDPRRVYRPITEPTPFRSIGLIWNTYRYQSQLLVNFREHLQDFCRSLGTLEQRR